MSCNRHKNLHVGRTPMPCQTASVQCAACPFKKQYSTELLAHKTNKFFGHSDPIPNQQ